MKGLCEGDGISNADFVSRAVRRYFLILRVLPQDASREPQLNVLEKKILEKYRFAGRARSQNPGPGFVGFYSKESFVRKNGMEFEKKIIAELNIGFLLWGFDQRALAVTLIGEQKDSQNRFSEQNCFLMPLK